MDLKDRSISKPCVFQGGSFFESGYNGVPYSRLADFETDVFYIHIDPIGPCRSFREELTSVLRETYARRPFTLIDDNSFPAQIVKATIPEVQTLKLEDAPTPEPGFIETCQRKFLIDDADMILGLYWATQVRQPLFFGKWELRILNANFIRAEGRSWMDAAYLVWVENERYYRFWVAKSELGVDISWNLLKSSAHLFRSYLLSEENIEWINVSAQSPHNYSAEQKLLVRTLCEIEGGTGAYSAESIIWPIGEWARRLKICGPLQQAAYPLHILFKKVFGIDARFNQFERSLYGEA